MHAFHCFMHYMHAFPVFQRKTLYINCVSLQNFPKKLGGGAKCITAPPNPFWGGGMVPLAPPPVADPMVQEVEINELTLGRSNSQKPSSLVFSSGNRHVVNNAY